MQNYIEVLPLGAGQCVGRSCIIVRIFDAMIMFDCGLMMAKNEKEEKYPDFNFLKKKYNKHNLNDIIDVVLITHFHLDHCGALPYLTELNGYSGPIFCSSPTKAIIPYMLEDYKKVFTQTLLLKQQIRTVSTNNSDIKNQIIYTSQQIKSSCQKIKTLQLMEQIIIKGITIKSYYAGHVLGACMFYVQYKGYKVVYTGDFNTNSDRHLSGAWIDQVNPHVLITQTTYASIIRDSKRDRQRNFLKYVQQTIDNGGKVLIPVFALGRAQQMCILLETYWGRAKNKIPIYFATGMIQKANFYYRLFVSWENQKIQNSFLQQNIFDFKYIKPFDKTLIRSANPMVLLATPGMLHGGLSMQVFKEWCSDPKNAIIIPGHCVQGTLGNKLLNEQRVFNIDKKGYEVKMKIYNISFSAHADAKGIANLIRNLEPKNVVFVHGEKSRMKSFSEVIKQLFNLNVYMPANFETQKIPIMMNDVQIEVYPKIVEQQSEGYIVKRNDSVRLMNEQMIINELNKILSLIRENNQEYENKEFMFYKINKSLKIPFSLQKNSKLNKNTIANDILQVVCFNSLFLQS